MAGAVLLALAVLWLLLSRVVPGMAQWHSQSVYRLTAGVLGRFWGLFPFSAAEICLYILLVLFFFTLIRGLFRAIREKNYKEEGAKWLSCWFLTAAALFFLYVINCGVNYQRDSFAVQEGFITEGYSDEELARVCLWLTDEINGRSDLVERDEKKEMRAGEHVQEEAAAAMEALGEQYPSLEGSYPRPKELIFSSLLSWQNLTGVYSPFTVEANYNGDITDYNIPFTLCHELAHLRGFMQEEEANFIAFLGCVNAKSTEFQYSGYLSAWIYAMNELNDRDVQRWSQIRRQLLAQADLDVRANSAFWQQYEGKVSGWSEKINDAYLKANGQEDGVESYNRMVELVVTYYHMEHAGMQKPLEFFGQVILTRCQRNGILYVVT